MRPAAISIQIRIYLVQDRGYKTIKNRDIAVIGLACRFPGAENYQDYWHNILNGVESVTCLSDTELEKLGIKKERYRQPNYVKACCRITDIDLFDAPFFDYSPKDAALTDPQYRLFLECCWKAMETSGYGDLSKNSNVGVYAGSYLSRYLISRLQKSAPQERESDIYTLSQSVSDYLSTNVSYRLKLTGPSLTVGSWCTSALAAVHLAKQALRSGECEMALAGGVQLRIPQEGYFYQTGGIEAADGHSRPLDAECSGTVPGEGVGVVVLKALEKALQDNDTIWAVIKGSGLSNDGRSPQKLSYYAPTIKGQYAAVMEAFQDSGTTPASIDYVEAHGTATELGDRLEIKALGKAFATYYKQAAGCAIGSVKANIGHLGAASGIAALIKTILMLKHKQLPAQINIKQPNRALYTKSTPFYLNQSTLPWRKKSTPRRAGINGYAFGGSNAHLILEESPISKNHSGNSGLYLFPFSAKTREAVNQYLLSFLRFLKQNPKNPLSDIAFTLGRGRGFFTFRTAIVASDMQQLVTAITHRNRQKINAIPEKPQLVTLAFSADQSSLLYLEQLAGQFPMFRETVDHYQATNSGLPAGNSSILETAFSALLRDCGVVTTRTNSIAREANQGPWIRLQVGARRGRETGQNQRIHFQTTTQDGDSALADFYGNLALLWSRGVNLDFARLFHYERPRRIPLPTYPFQKKAYWYRPTPIPGTAEKAGTPPRPVGKSRTTDKKAIQTYLVEIWRSLLGVQDIDIHRDFSDLGGNSLSAFMLINKLHSHYDIPVLDLEQFYAHPTIHGLTQSISACLSKSSAGKDKDYKRRAQRKKSPHKYVSELLSRYQGIIDPQSGWLKPRVLRRLIPQLHLRIKRDFALPLLAAELSDIQSPDELTNLIRQATADQTKRLKGAIPFTSFPWIPDRQPQRRSGKQKKGSAVFILSSPRAGSTLLRLMLGKHSRLFCPPELGLLMYTSMQERDAMYNTTVLSKRGLSYAVAHILGLDYPAAEGFTAGLTAADAKTAEVYAFIQSRIEPKILVDKTVDYAYKAATLTKAEALFDKPRYIYLTRHPYAVIESYVRNRFHKIIGVDKTDPFLQGEHVWLTCNANIAAFLENIETERCYYLKYEELVNHPQQVLAGICGFLKLEFEEGMLRPYQESQMLCGPGDPNIFNHNQIDPALGDLTRRYNLPFSPSQETRAVCSRLNYPMEVRP